MLTRLLGDGTTAKALREGLAHSSRRAREIAHRVANVTTPERGDFADTLDRTRRAEGGEGTAAELEREMVRMVDEQIRFEATGRLLSGIYDQIRSGIRER